MKFPLWAVFLCVLLAGCGTTASVNPGTYKDWEGELDSVEIVERFHLSAYQRVLVLPVDAGAVASYNNRDTQSSLDAIIQDSTKHIAEKPKTKLPGRAHIKVDTAAGNIDLRRNPGALLFKPRFATMRIGSSTARMFSGGFAGGSKISFVGEFIDGGTGRTLGRSEDEIA